MKAKSLLSYTKGHRIEAFLSPLFVCFEVFFEIAIPYVIGLMIDAGFRDKDFVLFKKLAIFLVCFAFLSLISGFLSAIFSAKAGSGFAVNLRAGVFDKIQEFSFSNIDKFSPGGLVTRLTSDIVNIQHAYQMIIRIAIRLPIMITFALIMSIHTSPAIAIIYLIVLPLIVLLIVTLMCIIVPLFKKGYKIVDETNEVTGENLRAMRVVKSYVKEEEEKKKFDIINTKHYKTFLKANRLLSIGGPSMRLTLYICLLLIAYKGAVSIIQGQMSTGALMSVFAYNTQILFSIMMFAMTLSRIVMSSACWGRIKEILKEDITIKNNSNPIMNVKDGSIEAKDLCFSYYNDKNKLSLKNINFKIESGSHVGIIGPTGSGKSTLISLFARLYEVSLGSLKVGGVEVKDYDLKTLRDSVAIVLQKNTLFSGTLRESLSWGKEKASDDEIYKALETAQIKKFVQNLDGCLNHIVEQNGDNFSGGQKQRLCIARALLKNPKIIVMDDSSSALDTATEKALLESLKSDHKDCTKITIAEKVSSVKNCDKIIVLKDGEVENIGTHNELIKKSQFYNTLCSVQCGVHSA